MAQLFGPGANLVTSIVLCGAAAGFVALIGIGWLGPRSRYLSGVERVVAQPVPFSHRHHAGELGLDCRYCHTTVETEATAGLPATHVCMTCHSQVWTGADMLAPLRRSLAEGRPLRWNRVNALPDYVFFDHAIHVAKGVGCTTCHGPIQQMALTWKGADLTMGWCLDCHRDPAPHLRPADAVFDPDWRPGADTPSGATLMAAYSIHPETLADCSVCHR